MKVVVMLLAILGTRVEAAPSDRGSVERPDPFPGATVASAVPSKSSARSPSLTLKRWLPSNKAAVPDGTTKSADKTTPGTIAAGARAGPGRSKVAADTTGLDKRAKMLKMISALEELHRAFNNTMSSRITIMPRANGRNPGRKSKLLPATDGGTKRTTSAPAAGDGTTSRAGGDVVPSLTGRNFRKSLPPQTKKPNKRVCFWKYCSQN
ncbi:urotensin II-related peptide [Brachyistius frenatus]|uniref:urotensin II-related peptide n=1 Tax=Brachyistius frenatus TaxID=100188 RepID=UPI0037E8D08C